MWISPTSNSSHLPPTKPGTTETMRPLNNCRSGKTLRISAVPTTSSLGRCKETCWMTFLQGFWPGWIFDVFKVSGDFFVFFSGVNIYLPFLMFLNDTFLGVFKSSIYFTANPRNKMKGHRLVGAVNVPHISPKIHSLQKSSQPKAPEEKNIASQKNIFIFQPLIFRGYLGKNPECISYILGGVWICFSNNHASVEKAYTPEI